MHMFGLGTGWRSKADARIARKLGATLVNYTDASCNCGHGCRPYTCKRSRRHWFEVQNLGEPFNSDKAREVMDAVKQQEGA
jgi:hypothetical protein